MGEVSPKVTERVSPINQNLNQRHKEKAPFRVPLIEFNYLLSSFAATDRYSVMIINAEKAMMIPRIAFRFNFSPKKRLAISDDRISAEPCSNG